MSVPICSRFYRAPSLDSAPNSDDSSIRQTASGELVPKEIFDRFDEIDRPHSSLFCPISTPSSIRQTASGISTRIRLPRFDKSFLVDMPDRTDAFVVGSAAIILDRLCSSGRPRAVPKGLRRIAPAPRRPVRIRRSACRLPNKSPSSPS